ncbi:hypothetical protein CR513_13892, partial [Mucuna pruriens]
MRLAKELEAKVLTAKSDSKLITGQVRGILGQGSPIGKVLRQNHQASDNLREVYPPPCTQGAKREGRLIKRGVQKSIIHESIGQLTIKEPEVGCVKERTTCMSPLMAYLRDEIKPEHPVKAKKLIKEEARYIIIGRELYKRGFSFPLLRCIEGEEARYVIKEVHEGLCGSHIEGQALVSKIAKAGYYWSTLKGDYMDYVRRCDKCQRFAEVGNAPPKQLHAITSPWSFTNEGWTS